MLSCHAAAVDAIKCAALPCLPVSGYLQADVDSPRSASPQLTHHQYTSTMSVKSDSIFKPDIFKGKVVFCTGANSGGICSIQVETLMRHGCNAAIFGRRAELSKSAAKEFENKTGKKCLGLSGDVRNYESLENAVNETIKAFGRIDFVIAGAAGNFLSPVSRLCCSAFLLGLQLLSSCSVYSQIEAASPRAFETVIGIDLVSRLQAGESCLILSKAQYNG